MTEFPHHRSLRLQNFTVFRDASFEFVPGVNVFIGENGAGKTHLLKALYTLQSKVYSSATEPRRESTTMEEIFQTSAENLLIRAGATTASITVSWGDFIRFITRIPSSSLPRQEYDEYRDLNSSISDLALLDSVRKPQHTFIPALDMMGHTRSFIQTYDKYDIDFDRTHRDIVNALLSPPLRKIPDESDIFQTLSQALGGEVELEGERFYLRTQHGRYPMPLVAEGLRKIATLQQLLKNDYLHPGDTLFWDEPEVNLNPKLMDEVVAVLLALARSGVQIFLATHSYVILKELDLQSGKDDSVRFFSLEPSDDGSIVHTSDTLAELQPNAILEQFDSLYDRELTRSVGPRRRP